MNVGQIYECLLGLAAENLNTRFKVIPFDEMNGAEASRALINKKLNAALTKKWLFLRTSRKNSLNRRSNWSTI